MATFKCSACSLTFTVPGGPAIDVEPAGRVIPPIHWETWKMRPNPLCPGYQTGNALRKDDRDV